MILIHLIPQNLIGEYTIDDKENISYEMTVNSKRFEAAYFQVTDIDKDTTGASEWVRNRILNKFGEEKWDSMSEEEQQVEGIRVAVDFLLEKVSHKSVWFMISGGIFGYKINIFYDNELNQANGDDL